MVVALAGVAMIAGFIFLLFAEKWMNLFASIILGDAENLESDLLDSGICADKRKDWKIKKRPWRDRNRHGDLLQIRPANPYERSNSISDAQMDAELDELEISREILPGMERELRKFERKHR